jgi:hypothetical protein
MTEAPSLSIFTIEADREPVLAVRVVWTERVLAKASEASMRAGRCG